MSGKKQFTFDLKGSIIGRRALYVPGDTKKVLKDVNFIELNKKEKLIEIPSMKFYHLFNTLKNDSEFLLKHGIMDYSTLLVIE